MKFRGSKSKFVMIRFFRDLFSFIYLNKVCNNAGGYVFKVNDLTRVRRFLILGTNGGTYYVTERKLTIENLDALIDIINRGKGGMILREIVSISLSGRSPKQVC